MEQGIVLIIVLTAAFITWKMVKDFYQRRFHKLIAHIIAIITSSFMLLSSMFLFMPKDYQRGSSQEVELSIMSIATVAIMVGVLYVFFRYASKEK
jgi:uncharacterized membrane protein